MRIAIETASLFWMDYLTQMEALRVSIGLEAYAQRDPLVQYKSKASELFQDLLSAMRFGVINRMFTYRPRDLSSVQSEYKRADTGPEDRAASLPEGADAGAPDEETPDGAEGDEETPPPAGQERDPNMSRSQKRRRRRH